MKVSHEIADLRRAFIGLCQMINSYNEYLIYYGGKKENNLAISLVRVDHISTKESEMIKVYLSVNDNLRGIPECVILHFNDKDRITKTDDVIVRCKEHILGEFL